MRSWSMSVRMTGTLSWRTKSSASWLAMRPAPTMPTPLTLRASERSGAPAGRLARLFTRSKEDRPDRGPAARRSEAGADDADAADLTGERAVGCSGGTLGALVHQIEGVQTSPELVRQEKIGK